jgi:hypothetical protein
MHESPRGCGLSASRGAGICLTGDRAQRAEPTRDLLNPIRPAQAGYTRFGFILQGPRRFHFVSNCHNSPRFVTATVPERLFSSVWAVHCRMLQRGAAYVVSPTKLVPAGTFGPEVPSVKPI